MHPKEEPQRQNKREGNPHQVLAPFGYACLRLTANTSRLRRENASCALDSPLRGSAVAPGGNPQDCAASPQCTGSPSQGGLRNYLAQLHGETVLAHS
ncbi:hypothetical protein [Brasilonema bromeliae]|uniref:hypothetical protein n=1 Tax=Brasilonema bromeliae TaxID=383615 RepID=UPI00145D3D6D